MFREPLFHQLSCDINHDYFLLVINLLRFLISQPAVFTQKPNP
jgi:hypothetical protein